MSKASIATLWRGGALALVLASAAACKKDEPPPPLPEPKAATTPEAPLQLKPEDAGAPVEEKKAPPKAAAARKPSGLGQCCAALRQNAANAPPPTKDYMIYAAGLCDMAAAQGKDKASVVSQLTAALKGAGLPADCK